MKKVEEKYVAKALKYLRLSLKKRVEFPNSSAIVEVYPQILVVIEDADHPLRTIEGSGVTLLAYLLQESQNDRGKARCSICSKECDCEKAFGGGICFFANSKRDPALDYLQFLRQKYPDIYIPSYKAADTGFDWADLLIHMDLDEGFTPRVGTIDVDNSCAEFVSEKQ